MKPLIRKCTRCLEWWPNDGEFYTSKSHPMCIACDWEVEDLQRRREYMRQAAQKYRDKLKAAV